MARQGNKTEKSFLADMKKSENQMHFTMVTSESPLVTFYGSLFHKLATFPLPGGIFVKHLYLNQDGWQKN